MTDSSKSKEKINSLPSLVTSFDRDYTQRQTQKNSEFSRCEIYPRYQVPKTLRRTYKDAWEERERCLSSTFFPSLVSRPIPTTPSYREQARRIILVDGTSCNRVARFWTAGERQAWNGSKRERSVNRRLVGWNKSHGTFTMARLFIQLPTRGVVSFINCTPASIFSWGANALSAKNRHVCAVTFYSNQPALRQLLI